MSTLAPGAKRRVLPDCATRSLGDARLRRETGSAPRPCASAPCLGTCPAGWLQGWSARRLAGGAPPVAFEMSSRLRIVGLPELRAWLSARAGTKGLRGTVESSSNDCLPGEQCPPSQLRKTRGKSHSGSFRLCRCSLCLRHNRLAGSGCESRKTCLKME